MKADLSRSTFSPQKHFRDVRLQQGRVQLDADWNEQVDITEHRVETETIDVVGTCGAPEHDAAFAIASKVTDLPTDQQAAATALGALATGDFFLSAGRFYAHGVLCENDAPVFFSKQPDFPGTTPIKAKGLYLAYLDVWPRHLTFLDDPTIREVALNGPDTATRVKNIWQVKLVQVGKTGDTPDCTADYSAYDNATAAPTGQLSARAEPGAANTKPCIIEPGAGYRSLENQLYRVEVHQGGANGVATFKWSRDNGAIVASWKPTATTNIIQLLRPPPDDKLGFAVGQWVEISDDNTELNGQPGMLVQLTHVDPQFLTLGTLPQPLTNFTLNPKVRRWDSSNAADTAGDIIVAANKWIDLENGVQVQFEVGTFRTGDYWLIPARTATANVEWPTDATTGNPIPSLPQGIPHVYCRLGFADFNGTVVTPTDCRSLFPPLTELPDCNLKLHNKHLHGWGVVCGLQVHCGGDRQHVTIEAGHAIDCEGTDILLKAAQSYDVISRAKALGLLDTTNSGDVVVQLTADAKDQPVFDLAAPPASSTQTFLQQILQGTIWMDFYNTCLQPFVTYFQKDFGTNTADTKLVPDNKRRLIAALNLLYQFANVTVGRGIWLSSAEHSLLQTAYNDLKALLSSDTFCAIKDGLGTFPSYPFTTQNITTAFGKTPLIGARLTPDGSTVIAFDNGNTGNFYLFNVASGEMTAALAVTGASPLTVRDVMVFGSSTAPRLLVAATGNGNTTLAVFDLNNHQLIGTSHNFYGLEVTRLELSPFDSATALAIAVGHGLFTFNPTNITPTSLAQPIVAFDAAGHLALSGNLIAATVNVQGMVGTYDHLMLGRIDAAGTGMQSFPLTAPDGTPTQGSDGLAIVTGSSNATFFQPALYVGVNARTGQTNKRLLVIDPYKPSTTNELALATTGDVALAAVDQKLLVGLTTECKLLWIDPTKNVVDATQALPAQIAPVAFATVTGAAPTFFAYNVETKYKNISGATIVTPVIAVNRVSQTLTIIPASLVGVTPAPVDFNALGTYRDALIAAFKDLVLRLGQGLKDCLCDRLLLDCPTCGKDDIIYLGRVEIRSGKVYHICNFIRRDVLTFPKVKYWLSAVPIIPVISWAVQKFCCSVLPELASSINQGGTFVSGPTATALFERVQTRNFNFNISDTVARYNVLGKFAAQALVARTVLAPQSAVITQTAPAAVLQASPESAAAALSDQGISVANVSDYHTALASDSPLIDASAVPLNLQPGDKVNLYTQNGRVVYYTRVNADTPVQVASEGTGSVSSAVQIPEVIGLQKELSSMRTQLTALQQGYATALATRDQQLAELKAATAKLSASMATLTHPKMTSPKSTKSTPKK